MEINIEVLEIAEKIVNLINSKNNDSEELEKYKKAFEILGEKLEITFAIAENDFHLLKGTNEEKKAEGIMEGIETALGIFKMVDDSLFDGEPAFDDE